MAIARALINLILLCIPGGIAALLSARLSRTSTDEWALLAWVPPLPLIGFGLYVGIVQARDPTAANLWPFGMIMFIGLTAILFGLFVVARRILRSTNSTDLRRRRDHTKDGAER